MRFPLALLVALAASLFQASALASGGDASRNEKSALCIIAPESFRGELQRFVEHKRRQLPTELVSLEDAVAAGTGVDVPERLKRFLHGEWKKGALRYVLLVGDADVMPVRYMVLDRVTPPAFDYAFYPSDLYYSDLAKPDGSFEDWNGAKDGFHAKYFGEVRGEKNKDSGINFDGIDYRPEVAVGRWPVSTPEEVRLLVNKTIRYEEALGEPGKAGAPRAALFSVGGWVDSRPAMDAASSLIESLGWKIDKRYFADARRSDGTPAPSRDQFVELTNAGTSLVLHAGHGQDDRWEQCVAVNDLPALTNEAWLPIVMSVGCSTARFATLPPYEPYLDEDGVEHIGTNFGEVFHEPPPPPAVFQSGRYNPPGLGEALLRKGPTGAVAYIGCNTGSQPCGLTLLEGFTQSLAKPNLESGARKRLGDCWSDAVRHYYEKEKLASIVPTKDWYPASIFFQAMKFMVFGDPSLLLP